MWSFKYFPSMTRVLQGSARKWTWRQFEWNRMAVVNGPLLVLRPNYVD